MVGNPLREQSTFQNTTGWQSWGLGAAAGLTRRELEETHTVFQTSCPLSRFRFC